MRPIRLELRNFLAFRGPQTVDFAGISLACATGANGVGKSSLLDAITWALWGKARGRREDDMMRLGADEMSVSVDFEQDGLRYRVARRRSRVRGSRAKLDLLLWGEDGGLRLINGEGIRRTQEKINRILRLDYETFTHSAYLRQGRADAFTLKTPAERKRILAEILGLEQWADYEKRAKAELAEVGQQIAILEHDIGRADEELSREPRLLEEMAGLTKACDEADEKLNALSRRYEEMANSASLLRRERESLDGLRRGIAARRVGIEEALDESEGLDGRIAAYEKVMAQADSIQAGYARLQEARENQSAIAEELARQQGLSERVHRLRDALAGEEAGLLRERDVLVARVAGLEERAAAVEAMDMDGLVRELAELETLDGRRESSHRAMQKLKERGSGLRGRLDALREEGMALNQRLERLAAAEGGDCPLCGQPLTVAHRDEVLKQLTETRDVKRHQYRDVTAEIKELEGEGRARQRELDGWAVRLKDLPGMQRKKGALGEQMAMARDAELELEIARGKLEGIQGRLDGEEYGRELRSQLRELEEERARVRYDAASHADNQARLETLGAYDRRQRELEIARGSLSEARTLREKARERLESLQGALSSDEEKLARAEGEIGRLESRVAQEGELRGQVDAMRAEARVLHERRAIAQQELNAASAGRATRKRLQKRLEWALRRQGLLKELRLAFGRDGVPALVIETAIPELEAGANALLGRMTDDRMRLRFKTRRETVAGSAVETLDIEIADELGARDYELYSGGEAFRINFAIRVALSKLLARRSGAHLRALFIDEGFGSQDAEGRGRLVEAISAIQSDFDLILVITHIDELRDMFSARLLVEKTAEGSVVLAQ